MGTRIEIRQYNQYVDPTGLMQRIRNWPASPQPPAPIAVSGIDLAAAINETMPASNRWSVTQPPGAKAALTRTASNMNAAADVYVRSVTGNQFEPVCIRLVGRRPGWRRPVGGQPSQATQLLDNNASLRPAGDGRLSWHSVLLGDGAATRSAGSGTPFRCSAKRIPSPDDQSAALTGRPGEVAAAQCPA